MMDLLDDTNIAALPPYTPHDPHPTSHIPIPQASDPSTSPSPTRRSHSDDAHAPIHISGAPYFAMHPPPHPRPPKLLAYSILILPYTRPEELGETPITIGIRSRDVDQQGWHAFLNHLFPFNAGESGNAGEKTRLQRESEGSRCHRLNKVVDEWNEGFFLPRGVSIILQTEQPPPSVVATQNKTNSELGKALYEVVKKQDVATAKVLLTYGADPDWRPSCATPMIVEAVKRGNEEIVQMLLERGPDLEATAPCAETALYSAVSKDKAKMLKLLLKYGAQVNNSHPSGGEPALYLACRKEYIDVVHILLETDADLEKRPSGGCTPLYKMVERQQLPMVQLLLSKGAKPETRAPGSASAMFRAAEKNNVDLVRLLLYYGADVDSTSPGGNTALLEVINKGDVEMIRLLLRHGANVHAKSYGGDTPVSKASKKGNTELVRMLLDQSTPLATKT